jgi:pimeloyl-ACP methyl ester carboxylesterase
MRSAVLVIGGPSSGQCAQASIDVNPIGEELTTSNSKPSIVFAHGLWADGSCFYKLIPTLQAEGYEVIASQHALDSVEDDVATLRSTLGRVSSPAILVGHSCGGTLITAAGTDEVLEVIRTAASSI